MAANFVLLEKITVGAAGASSVTFSGIPQTGYTDLVVKVSARDGASSVIDGAVVRFNNDTTSGNYTARRVIGSGSAASSDTNNVGAFAVGNTATANTFSNCEFYIPNYTGSSYKSVSFDNVAETNATTQYMGLAAFLWSNTAAITSIQISGESASFSQYSTFYLYGVAKLGTTPAIVPYATGGDTIMTDGTYWYHTFVSSGTFTPQKALSCDYLVVAGGGGGGGSIAFYGSGGGGAGGLRSTVTATGGGGSLESKLSLGTSAYTVTVGAGGTSSASNNGTNGSNSVFATITATGGGGGAVGSVGTSNGLSGGSGGGASDNGGTGGAGTANQGYAGGNSTNNSHGAGGGGSGSVGVNATTAGIGTNGGNGVNVSITGSSVAYAGGGGGGSYTGNSPSSGQAGGGAGGVASAGTNGTANTGGGGGAAGCGSGTYAGGTGGSGIVIVRYAV
jgi:hypothetical protein